MGFLIPSKYDFRFGVRFFFIFVFFFSFSFRFLRQRLPLTDCLSAVVHLEALPKCKSQRHHPTKPPKATQNHRKTTHPIAPPPLPRLIQFCDCVCWFHGLRAGNWNRFAIFPEQGPLITANGQIMSRYDLPSLTVSGFLPLPFAAPLRFFRPRMASIVWRGVSVCPPDPYFLALSLTKSLLSAGYKKKGEKKRAELKACLPTVCQSQLGARQWCCATLCKFVSNFESIKI